MIPEKYKDDYNGDDVFDINYHDGLVISSEKNIHKNRQVRVYYARLDYKSYRRKGGFEGIGLCKHHLIGVRLLNHGAELPIDEFKNCIILKKDKERMIVTITDGLLEESGYSPDMDKEHSDDMSDIDKLTYKEITNFA